MKNFICKLPAWQKVLLYFMILTACSFIAGIVPALNNLTFYLAASLLMSWLFLWSEGESLKTLQSVPSSRRHWRQLLLGTIAGIAMLIITVVATLYLTGNHWQINPSPDVIFLMICFLVNLYSAFVQEFTFRGYPFQTLLNGYGAWPAQLLIAIPFGLMHVNGSMDLKAVLTVMLTTGLGSVLFGLAYIYTRNLALPIGLHFGWNFAQALIPRTAGSTGKLLITVSGNPAHYTTLQIIGPYVVIIICALIILRTFRYKWPSPDDTSEIAPSV